MTDIVGRLRAPGTHRQLRDDAADEIERLRAALAVASGQRWQNADRLQPIIDAWTAEPQWARRDTQVWMPPLAAALDNATKGNP